VIAWNKVIVVVLSIFGMSLYFVATWYKCWIYRI